MIALTATTETLELVTAAALNLDVAATYVDTTATTHAPGSTQATISTATTTSILSAPGSGVTRGLSYLSAINRSTSTAQTITLQKDVSATDYKLFGPCVLQPGEMVQYTPQTGFRVLDAAGRLKQAPLGDGQGTRSYPAQFFKSVPAGDAAGYWVTSAAAVGVPPAYTVGSPGVNGRATDGTTATDAGGLFLSNAAAGYGKYLSRADIMATAVSGLHLFADVLWLNSGLTVTTTTNQAITTPTWPARDAVGGTNGEGLMIGLWFTSAATNAAVINNSTVTYTNTGGTGSRSATLSAVVGLQIPATPVVNTVVWFALQAGDTGVKSIEGITLNTSLVTGAISLFVARPLVAIGCAANYPSLGTLPAPGVRVYDGACILHFANASTSAHVVSGLLQFSEQ